MAQETRIVVREQEAIRQQSTPLTISSTIAVIGAFDSEITNLTICANANEAHQKFGTMENEGAFKGTDAIDGLFYGASSLSVVNITTYDTSGDDPVAETTITSEKLVAALDKLHNERFDILFIADQLSDTLQTTVSAWLDAEFESKYCHGQVAQLQKSTAQEYATSVAKFNNNVYYINTQQFTMNGTSLSLNRSTAFIAGYIASLTVDTSLTSKIIPGVTAVTPEYSTAAGQMGATLLGLNIPFLKCRNRRLQTFYCVNSMLPDELDLYINRTRDTILNNMAVETAFGQQNNEKTENGIITLIEGLKQSYVNDLNLLEDIEYHVEKINTNTINVVIDSMLFADIVTTINIYYTINVE